MELHNSREDIIYWLLCLVFCGFQKNSAECKYSKSHWCPFPLREKIKHPKPQNPKPQKPKQAHTKLYSVYCCLCIQQPFKSDTQMCQQQVVLISERFLWRVRLEKTQTISQRKEQVTDEALLRLQDLLFLPFCHSQHNCGPRLLGLTTVEIINTNNTIRSKIF